MFNPSFYYQRRNVLSKRQDNGFILLLGNTQDALYSGVYSLFPPHGLGHGSWCPLSDESIRLSSKSVKTPDFTREKWKTNKPIFGLSDYI